VRNGNAPNDTPCDDGSGLLCNASGLSTTLGGAPIQAFLGPNPLAYSELDVQTTNTNRYGASAQVTDTGRLFGLENHLVAGVGFDGAQTMFTGSSNIGGISMDTRDFLGPGVVIDEPGINGPVRVAISDAYYGVFVTDTLHLTDLLAVTAAGRFNLAKIDLSDQNGGDLSGNHTYSHFNPAIGLTYRLAPWLTPYAAMPWPTGRPRPPNCHAPVPPIVAA